MGAQCTAITRILLCLLCFAGVLVSGALKPRSKDYDHNNNDNRLCDVKGCNCTKTAGPWLTINCTFDSTQEVHIAPGSIPSNTIEVSINGGNGLTISAQSFHILRAFALLRLEGTKHVIIRRNAFDNLNSTSLDLQVVGCNYFLLENNAFKNMQTPIRADISRCDRVTVKNSAFGRLQEARFSFIQFLELMEGAFQFENQGALGRHGPVTNLSFHNVTIPKIPRNAFMSALADIYIVNSDINAILAEAFKSNQINAIFLNGTRIERLHSGAFSERTQIFLLRLTKCHIEVLESHAIMAAITNFTVEFSFINEVQSGAVNSSVTANIVISENQMRHLAPYGFVFKGWNRVLMENNIIKHMRSNFLSVPYNPDILDFSFSGNEIWNVDQNAFASIPNLQQHIVRFKFHNNFFNQSCHCNISDWLSTLLNNTHVHYIKDTSFCMVDSFISSCFKIPQDIINMANFSELVCGPGSVIKCKPYKGETKVLNATTVFLTDDSKNTSHVILYLTLLGLLAVAIVATVVILTVKGSMWLRNKRQNLRYSNDSNVTEEESDIVTVTMDGGSKFDAPEELTAELLALLREQLQDPVTHDQARAMIENLYARFVVEDSYAFNKTRQEDEQHLYEELGNMQSNMKPAKQTSDCLKAMEDRFSNISSGENARLANQYSDPIDAPIHLYSELKNKQDEDEHKKASNISLAFSIGTNGSARMQFRPLPDKPSDAGPSKGTDLQY